MRRPPDIRALEAADVTARPVGVRMFGREPRFLPRRDPLLAVAFLAGVFGPTELIRRFGCALVGRLLCPCF